MANGVAVALLPSAAPTSAATPTSTATPTPTAAGKPIETAIGDAMANAVTTLYQAAINQQQTGTLAPSIIAAGGSRIAALALLQLDHAGGDIDFVARAHRDGKRELRRCFNNTDLFQQHDPVEIDKVFDTSISDVLGIVSRVVRDERVYRAAWAN
jgi:hypothetical protein